MLIRSSSVQAVVALPAAQRLLQVVLANSAGSPAAPADQDLVPVSVPQRAPDNDEQPRL